MRILAIDPGYDRLGIAVVEGTASRPVLIWSDCVTPEKSSASKRLATIARAIEGAVQTHSPDALALETLFFSINKKTALGVAEARGVVLAAAGKALLPVFEYSPQQVKSAVTGNGRADKRSLARMIPLLLSLPKKKRLDDELDAIGIGITALARNGGSNPHHG
jgi:crossover junction endodeoxyribonuclease RuvC